MCFVLGTWSWHFCQSSWQPRPPAVRADPRMGLAVMGPGMRWGAECEFHWITMDHRYLIIFGEHWIWTLTVDALSWKLRRYGRTGGLKTQQEAWDTLAVAFFWCRSRQLLVWHSANQLSDSDTVAYCSLLFLFLEIDLCIMQGGCAVLEKLSISSGQWQKSKYMYWRLPACGFHEWGLSVCVSKPTGEQGICAWGTRAKDFLGRYRSHIIAQCYTQYAHDFNIFQ